MIVKAYKTHKIIKGDNLFRILDSYLPKLHEKSVVVITSKIISICQGDLVKIEEIDIKDELIKQEADLYYQDDNLLKHWILYPTIKNNILAANAGIDHSNGNNYFILWPNDIENTVAEIWKYLRKKWKIKHLGVIVSDSRSTPLRWGVHGISISWCGFEALKDYRNKKDIFGDTLHMTQESIIDGLASSAVVVMGEGNEQTPLATITDIPFVVFQNRPPTKKERAVLFIPLEKDIYGKMLTSVKWQKGGK